MHFNLLESIATVTGMTNFCLVMSYGVEDHSQQIAILYMHQIIIHHDMFWYMYINAYNKSQNWKHE